MTKLQLTTGAQAAMGKIRKGDVMWGLRYTVEECYPGIVLGIAHVVWVGLPQPKDGCLDLLRVFPGRVVVGKRRSDVQAR